MTTMFSRIGNYFVTAYAELQKVVWPSRRDLVSHTIIICVSVVLTMAILGVIDLGLTTLLRDVVLK